ncbi:MAG: hypothetical protein PHG85_05735 [Candidatus Altiarchaeota archaeon]|nr:hypothetical protein [Candidatus Altiarchaeota archaeon]
MTFKDRAVQHAEGDGLGGPNAAKTLNVLGTHSRLRALGDLEGKTVFPHLNVDPRNLRYGISVEVYVPGKGTADSGTGIKFSLSLGRDGPVFLAHTKDPKMAGVEMSFRVGDSGKVEKKKLEGVCPDGLGLGFNIPEGTKGPLVIEKVGKRQA